MALFKEIFCKECGAKAGMLARTKLGDGNYICNKCLTIVPNYIKKCLSDYSYEQYMMMKQYLIWSTSELGKVFKENHYFHGIHIDTQHGIFYFDSSLFGKPVYLLFSNVEDFDLQYAAEEFKEGFLGDKVNGKILFRLKMNEPYFYHEDVLAYDVKATAKKSFFGNKVEYDNPAGMNEFMNYFLNAWKAGLDAKTAQLQAQADALLNQNQY